MGSFKNIIWTIWFFLAITTANRLPKFIQCQDSSECPIGFCCLLGMGRFTFPKCSPWQWVGESCKSQDEGKPQNVTLYYPNGVFVELTNIYYQYCPCDVSFQCSEKNKCVDNWEGSKFNIIEAHDRK